MEKTTGSAALRGSTCHCRFCLSMLQDHEDAVVGGGFGEELCYNAFSYGNVLCHVNDPSTDPLNSEGRANVQLATVQLNGFPFLMMYVIEVVEPGIPRSCWCFWTQCLVSLFEKDMVGSKLSVTGSEDYADSFFLICYVTIQSCWFCRYNYSVALVLSALLCIANAGLLLGA